MNITDIPAELQEKFLRNIEDYSIVLLVDGQLCGTGTLITIDGVHGILTAAHVAQTLDESERAGTLATVLDRQGSQLVGEPAKHFESFATKPAGEWGLFGPDLAFVRLPSPSGLLSGLLMKKSFWDLTRKGVAQRPVVILDKTPMASYGAVDERTERTENMVRLNTFLVYGASPKVFEREGYDYIDMRSRRSLQPEMPMRFGGLSGSGVWFFDIARYHKDRFEVFGFHLAGVAFYQLPESEPDIVAIRYHGPLSVWRVGAKRPIRSLIEAGPVSHARVDELGKEQGLSRRLVFCKRSTIYLQKSDFQNVPVYDLPAIDTCQC